jgi:hypothetical protein
MIDRFPLQPLQKEPAHIHHEHNVKNRIYGCDHVLCPGQQTDAATVYPTACFAAAFVRSVLPTLLPRSDFASIRPLRRYVSTEQRVGRHGATMS